MITIKPETTVIGFVGLGVMGTSMAGHLLDAGYPLHVYTRTRSSAADLINRGAVWAPDIPTLASASDVVITMVGYPEDVEQVYLGPSGILNHASTGSLVVDMTTSRPDLAVTVYDRALKNGIYALDAPVSGGDLGAKNATLSIMVGGEIAVFEAALPLLRIMGKNIVFQGPSGSGQSTKMANQIAIAAGMVGVCEALAYAGKAGLNPEAVLKSIGQGAAGSWSLNHLGPRMLNQDYDPGFYVKHFIKDMSIAVQSARKVDLQTPGLDLALSLYRRLAENGDENLGTQALFKLFNEPADTALD